MYKDVDRLVMRDGDPSLVLMEFADMVAVKATGVAEAVVESRPPRIFLWKRANMMFAMISTVMQSHELAPW